MLIPLLFAEASPLVQAARQDAERAALGHGQNRERASTARPDLAREHGCSKRALGEAMDGGAIGPSARAVGQEGEPKVPDVSRANKRGWPLDW